MHLLVDQVDPRPDSITYERSTNSAALYAILIGMIVGTDKQCFSHNLSIRAHQEGYDRTACIGYGAVNGLGGPIIEDIRQEMGVRLLDQRRSV